jgi:rRNA small subunit pseudouridine methyltransferase Nep1
MLHLILADSELEQVPKEIAKHPAVQSLARKRGRRPTELILNSSFHHPAMKKLQDAGRRGRPDIVHFSLLTALDSPLNQEGGLMFHVHTRDNHIISVDPSAELPRMYNRFEGLMEQLFLTMQVPPEKPLLRLEKSSIEELVKKIKPKRVIVFSEKAPRKKVDELFSGLSFKDDVCAIIGGFPHGDYLSNVRELAQDVVSISPKTLTAPVVIARIIHSYEMSFGID